MALRLILLVLAVLVFGAHAPLRHSDYIQDDHLAVENNAIVERGDLREIFTTTYWEGAQGQDRSLYRPLVILSFAAERRITGEPVALLSHTVNLLLQILATWMLLAYALRVGIGFRASVIAAMLFAVHPVHVEAVAGVVGRAEILAAGLSLLALWLADLALGARTAAGQRALAWAAGLTFLLALLSKEVAVAAGLPLVIRLWIHRRDAAGTRSWITPLGVLLPWVAALLTYLVLRTLALDSFLALQPIHRMDNPLVELTGTARLATALALIPRYVGLLLFPTRLSADYSGPVIPIYTELLTAAPLIGLILGATLLLLAIRPLHSSSPTTRRVGVAAVLFVAPYLIVGNLIFPVGAIFAERFIYFSSAGFCLGMGLLIAYLTRLPRLARLQGVQQAFLVWTVPVMIVAAFSTLTYLRCQDWRDDRTLFTAAVHAQPRSPRANYILGRLAREEGQPEEALAWLDRTLDLFPDHSSAWMEKGNALAEMGHYVEAEAMFRRTLEIAPSYYLGHYNLALTLHLQRRLDEAERALRKAVLWQPRAHKSWAQLGHVRMDLGDHRGAAEAYRQAIALGRRDLGPRLRQARALAGDV